MVQSKRCNFAAGKLSQSDRFIWEGNHSGVVWHTGKVLAWEAVGPRFNSRQGQGIL